MTDKVISAGNSQYQYYVNTGSRGENQKRRLYLTRIHRESKTKKRVKISQADLIQISAVFNVLEDIIGSKLGNAED